MNHAEAISRLKALRAEAATLPPSTSSAEFNSWKPRTRSALTRALGEKHHITQRFVRTKWTPSMYTLGLYVNLTQDHCDGLIRDHLGEEVVAQASS